MHRPPDSRPLSFYVGLMSGTSMDGVDAVLGAFSTGPSGLHVRTLAATHHPFPGDLRAQLLALQSPGENELHRAALAANALSTLYGNAVTETLRQAGMEKHEIRAIGVHGQTVRHRPDCGYTWQIGNPALLAELTGIDVVADLRNRDIAAGGQGAPLAPAFHRAVFSKDGETRLVVNIGGIANISVLDKNGSVYGFDTGPGNVLLDTWCQRHLGKAYDENGAWAASGEVVPELLHALMREPYLQLPPPKSTGRDLFHADWLLDKLSAFPHLSAANVQATLTAFTAATLADAMARHATEITGIYICGGGAYNAHLLSTLKRELVQRGVTAPVCSTAELGVPPHHVEALAFAWLAQCHVERLPGNLVAVTGAQGPRILGALYPA